MSSFGRLTGFGLNGKESVNAPFSAEQLTIKAELLAIAEASQSDILAKLQEVAPNMLQTITSEQQAKDRAAAQAAAEVARQEEPAMATVFPIEQVRSSQPPADSSLADKWQNVQDAYNVAA